MGFLPVILMGAYQIKPREIQNRLPVQIYHYRVLSLVCVGPRHSLSVSVTTCLESWSVCHCLSVSCLLFSSPFHSLSAYLCLSSPVGLLSCPIHLVFLSCPSCLCHTPSLSWHHNSSCIFFVLLFQEDKRAKVSTMRDGNTYDHRQEVYAPCLVCYLVLYLSVLFCLVCRCVILPCTVLSVVLSCLVSCLALFCLLFVLFCLLCRVVLCCVVCCVVLYCVVCCLVSSCLVSCLVLPCLLSCRVRRLVLSCLVRCPCLVYCLVLSCLVCCLVLPCIVCCVVFSFLLCCVVLFCFVYCLVLSCVLSFVLSYHSFVVVPFPTPKYPLTQRRER
jgi:hypothetical protein